MKLETFGTADGNMHIAIDGEFVTGWYDKEKATEMFHSKQWTHTSYFPEPFNPRIGESSLNIKIESPTLIVGANNYLRTKLPFFIQQKYQICLFFMPGNDYYRVGAILVNRTAEVKPVFAYCENKNIIEALKSLIIGITIEGMTDKHQYVSPKLLSWFESWVNRCPKISLNEVLYKDIMEVI